jgi:enoyl-CoA hydratase/carnithine racemase
MMYDGWLACLQTAKVDPNVKVVIVRGNGPIFCSGQELVIPDLTDRFPTLELWYQSRVQVTKTLVELMIDYPKPLIACVHGMFLNFVFF